jgi:hypothetical protein
MARTVKASIVVMSHLSDVQHLMSVQHVVSANDCINFAKYIILQTGGNLNQEIDADAMYKKFKEKTPVMG